MNGREVRMVMVATQAGTVVERAMLRFSLIFSPVARGQFRDYERVSKLLRSTLQDEDSVISVRLRRTPSKAVQYALLGLTVVVILLLLGAYTKLAFPDAFQWGQSIVHRC